MRRNRSEEAMRQVVLRDNLRMVFASVGIVILSFAFFYWIYLQLPSDIMNDVKGSKARWAEAEIVSIYPRKRYGQLRLRVVVRMSDGTIGDVELKDPVKVGQKLRVRYRKGKSGVIWIERVAKPVKQADKPLASPR